MLKPSGCGPQPTLLIQPAGRTRSSAILSVMLAPAASITPSQPSPSRCCAQGLASPMMTSQPYCLRDLETVRVLRQADDGDLGAAEPRHRRAEDADGAGAEHDDAVAGLDARVLHDRIVGDAAGLGEAGLLERQLVGHVVQDARGHADVFGHGAIHAVAEALAGGVEIVEAAPGHRVVRRDDGGGLADDAVAFLPALHLLADFDDAPAELVAEHDRVIHRPGVIGGPLVQVAAADADVGDFEQDILRADGGLFDLADFDGVFFGGVS